MQLEFETMQNIKVVFLCIDLLSNDTGFSVIENERVVIEK